MTEIAFLWPFPSEAPVAAAARLASLERAAVQFGLTYISITPSGSRRELVLYDSFVARFGVVLAVCAFPLAVVRLARCLRNTNVSCAVASTPGPILPFQALLVARLLDIPFILDVRDSWSMEIPTHLGRLRNRIKALLERATAHAANRVLAVTPTLLGDITRDYDLNTESVVLIPNGADLDIFHPIDGLRNVDLVFVGTPAHYRNIQGLLEAITKLREFRRPLVVECVGWADAPNAEEVRRLIDRSPAAENVRLLPSTPRQEIPGILSTAWLGVVSLSDHASFRGSVGTKAYEYIACGLPIACLGPPGESELRTLIVTRDIGFYATTPDTFAREANRLLQDHDTWTRLSKNCVKASAEFDRRLIAERVFNQVILPLLPGRSRA